MDSSQNAENLNNFVAITGAPAAAAQYFLEAAGEKLEEAVELYFNSQGTVTSAAFSDEELAQRLAANGNKERTSSSNPIAEEHNVRAPIPVKRDRLYGDDLFSSLRGRTQALRAPSHEISAFRDFEAEGSKQTKADRSHAKSRLGQMFEPPKALIFLGDFEEAKEEAGRKAMWLLVNIQSNTEFSSHQLNRDTWGDATLQEVLRTNLIFAQYHDTAPEGQKVQSYYRLASLPAIVIIDPVTGSAMRTLTGFIGAERLMEELIPFFDTKPDDPDAHRLGQALHKRKPSSEAAIRPMPPAENDELQQAIAMSMAPTRQSAGESAIPSSMDGQVSVEAEQDPHPAAREQYKKVPEEVQAAALSSLPPEASGIESCRVAVRLPDGTRIQRMFPKKADLNSIRTLCLANSLEAAGGKAFVLKEARPGAPTLTNLHQTLEDAGLANSLISMSWL